MKNKFIFFGSVFILILSVITFIFFGTGTELLQAMGMGGKNTVWGTYKGKKILMEPGTLFARYYEQYENNYKSNGQELNDYVRYYIYSSAFSSAVQETVFREAVKESGYEPTPEMVARKVLPFYTMPDGKFSSDYYNMIPAAEREYIQDNITLTGRYTSDLTGGDSVGGKPLFGLKTSKDEVEFIKSMGDEKHAFDMAAFKLDSYPESEVAAYAKENAALFDSYKLSAVTVLDEAKAKSILNQLKNKEITFEDAVSQYSEKNYTESSGKITAAHKYQLQKIIPDEKNQEAVFALTKDSYSEVISTSVGYTIFRCDGEKSSADVADSALVALVRQYIEENESGRIEDYFVEAGKALARDAALSSFDDACKNAGVENIAVPAFALNYGSVSVISSIPEIEQLAEVGTNENFLQKAFALKEGEISEPISVGDYVIVLKMTGIEKADTDESKTEAIESDISGYDQSAAYYTLFHSGDVVNNVSSVYSEMLRQQNASK